MAREDGRKTTRELALAALTYISFNWDSDRERALERLTPLFEQYSMAELREGAMSALALILIQQADAAGVSVAHHADEQRAVIDHNLRPQGP